MKPQLCLCLGAALVTVSQLVAQTQRQSADTYIVHELHNNTVDIPPFSSGPRQCDSRGNVYYDLTGSRYSKQIILRVSKDGKTALPLIVSSQSEAQGVQVSYYISPEGEAYTIVSHSGQSEMSRRSSSGEVTGRVTLPPLPRCFLLQSFAVLEDQTAMLVGITPISETVANPSYQAQAFWIDPKGALIHPIKNGMDVPDALRDQSFVTTDGSDKFVEFTEDNLITFTKQGEVVTKYPLSLPSSNYFVSGMQYLGGKVGLLVSQVVDEDNQPVASASGHRYGPLKQSWIVVNLSDGSAEHLYSMPPTFVGSADCYLGGEHFLYSHVENGQRQLLEVGP